MEEIRYQSRHTSLWVGFIIVFLAIFVALFASYLAPQDPFQGKLMMRLRPPFWSERGTLSFLLGTDSLGRDILSRMIVGSRISLIVGFASVALQGILGCLLGLIAGYWGKWIDACLMRLADIQLTIPFLILALAICAVLGPGVVNIIIVLGITGWATYARLARAMTLQQKEMPYVYAAIAIGQKPSKILLRHILPNISSSLIVAATFQLARMIIAEASLSFLGLGVPPEIPTWGGLVASGKDYMTTAWWISAFPGLAIMIVVLGINLLGNGLRDILDPRAK
jgi:peptide/nickel transport system permease protein